MASGAFEAQIDKMFGTPDQGRLYGSWQLAEGIREGLANHPVGLAPPLRNYHPGCDASQVPPRRYFYTQVT